MQTAMWITLGYAGYCVVIGAGWYALVSLVRGRWTRG
jgi:hypothetical protein